MTGCFRTDLLTWLLASLALTVAPSGFVFGQWPAGDSAEPGWQGTTPAAPIPWQPLAPVSGAQPAFDGLVEPAGFHAAAPVAPGNLRTAAGTGPVRLADSTGPEDGAFQVDLALPAENEGTGGSWLASLRRLLAREIGGVHWGRMLASLGMVIGGWLLVVSLVRHWSPRAGRRLPATVFELVGSTRLNSRQSLQLVRVGPRLLVLIVSPEGAQAVGEISHPGEVESLISHCNHRGGQPIRAAHSCPSCGAGATAAARDDATGDSMLRALQQALNRPSTTREFQA